MKKWTIVIALMLLFFLSGCPAQVRPTVTEDGPGIEFVIGGETAEKIETGISKIEGLIETANDLLPVIVDAARKIGEASGNEDIEEKSGDVADVAEKAAAGLGLLTLILGIAKGVMKKEDD